MITKIKNIKILFMNNNDNQDKKELKYYSWTTMITTITRIKTINILFIDDKDNKDQNN